MGVGGVRVGVRRERDGGRRENESERARERERENRIEKEIKERGS